jgi:hypothetical protein
MRKWSRFHKKSAFKTLAILYTYIEVMVKLSLYQAPWRPIGLWDVRIPRFIDKWRWGCQPYAPATLYPQTLYDTLFRSPIPFSTPREFTDHTIIANKALQRFCILLRKCKYLLASAWNSRPWWALILCVYLPLLSGCVFYFLFRRYYIQMWKLPARTVLLLMKYVM